jgi:crotonobetainyl-CoA:carnitine CoA-transferase CaiB-like acyl-CoA transferase
MPETEPNSATAGFLAPYRVLDLTDHRGALAGHMFAQMGADVIQVEPSSGSPARRQPPFAPDWPEGENSLYWAAYASGKRSIVCDPDTPDGLALLRRLVERADFLFESTAPRDGRPAWLDPAALARMNPRLVHVSITPFGLTGPKRDWADSEITLWAAGGPLLATRTLDDRPIRISAPQAYLHAAGDAAGGALIAHFARLASGRGQHVDISVQQSVPQATLSSVLAAAVHHPDFTPRPPKPGEDANAKRLDLSGSGALTRRSKWQVRDGIAEMHLAMGPTAGVSTNLLFAWMRREGALDERFWDWDWLTLHERVRAGELDEVDLDAAREAVARFMSTRRKAELMDTALETGIRMAPVETIADLTVSPHSAARGFFQRIEGPFGAYLVPGDFAFGAPDGFTALRPAPRLGEHTAEILAELGVGEAV